MKGVIDFASRAYSPQNDGWVITIGTVTLTAVLELASISHVRQICGSDAGRSLYLQGVAMNIVNNVILGPLAYQLVNELFMSEHCGSAYQVEERVFLLLPLSFLCSLLVPLWHACLFPSTHQVTGMVLCILLGQALGYYLAHRSMHTPCMYWTHRFHHKFNKHVVPVTANAVSLAEYAVAYMMPFIVGSAVLGPDRVSMFIAVCIISLNNLLIHTPALADLSANLLPWVFVSTADHIEHHRRLTCHYAAPTISIDRLLSAVYESKGSLWDAIPAEGEGSHQKKKVQLAG